MNLFAPAAWLNALSDSQLQLLTVLGVILGIFGFMYLTSEIFPHRILERIIQIVTMLLITTAF
ncbi:MAG TPA: hypothetical protein VFA09_01575 [Ktedonobacteraceae bacterium]|jgi:hypothetical protein|nr:hypothetical protein [Ktedonobacteraceae bacterium]